VLNSAVYVFLFFNKISKEKILSFFQFATSCHIAKTLNRVFFICKYKTYILENNCAYQSQALGQSSYKGLEKPKKNFQTAKKSLKCRDIGLVCFLFNPFAADRVWKILSFFVLSKFVLFLSDFNAMLLDRAGIRYSEEENPNTQEKVMTNLASCASYSARVRQEWQNFYERRSNDGVVRLVTLMPDEQELSGDDVDVTFSHKNV